MTRGLPEIKPASELRCSAEEVGKVYAVMQRENHLFTSCGAGEEEMAEYGAFLFRMAKGDSSSMVLEEDGKCVGMYLQVDSEVLDNVDETVLGDNRCKYHLAFCKDLQRRILINFAKTYKTPQRVKYGIFGGVTPAWEGTGIFPKLQMTAVKAAYDQGVAYSWGFTHNPAIINKSLKQKEGMPGNVKGVPSFMPTEAITTSLLSLPLSILRIIAAAVVKAGAIRVSEVHDCVNFKYKGKRVFKKSQVVWVGIYTTDPARTHGATTGKPPQSKL